ncbi:hypothetical protein AAMO2058_001147100 [Amorphochlora amoebiformis]
MAIDLRPTPERTDLRSACCVAYGALLSKIFEFQEQIRRVPRTRPVNYKNESNQCQDNTTYFSYIILLYRSPPSYSRAQSENYAPIRYQHQLQRSRASRHKRKAKVKSMYDLSDDDHDHVPNGDPPRFQLGRGGVGVSGRDRLESRTFPHQGHAKEVLKGASKSWRPGMPGFEEHFERISMGNDSEEEFAIYEKFVSISSLGEDYGDDQASPRSRSNSDQKHSAPLSPRSYSGNYRGALAYPQPGTKSSGTKSSPRLKTRKKRVYSKQQARQMDSKYAYLQHLRSLVYKQPGSHNQAHTQPQNHPPKQVAKRLSATMAPPPSPVNRTRSQTYPEASQDGDDREDSQDQDEDPEGRYAYQGKEEGLYAEVHSASHSRNTSGNTVVNADVNAVVQTAGATPGSGSGHGSGKGSEPGGSNPRSRTQSSPMLRGMRLDSYKPNDDGATSSRSHPAPPNGLNGSDARSKHSTLNQSLLHLNINNSHRHRKINIHLRPHKSTKSTTGKNHLRTHSGPLRFGDYDKAEPATYGIGPDGVTIKTDSNPSSPRTEVKGSRNYTEFARGSVRSATRKINKQRISSSVPRTSLASQVTDDSIMTRRSKGRQKSRRRFGSPFLAHNRESKVPAVLRCAKSSSRDKNADSKRKVATLMRPHTSRDNPLTAKYATWGPRVPSVGSNGSYHTRESLVWTEIEEPKATPSNPNSNKSSQSISPPKQNGHSSQTPTPPKQDVQTVEQSVDKFDNPKNASPEVHSNGAMGMVGGGIEVRVEDVETSKVEKRGVDKQGMENGFANDTGSAGGYSVLSVSSMGSRSTVAHKLLLVKKNLQGLCKSPEIPEDRVPETPKLPFFDTERFQLPNSMEKASSGPRSMPKLTPLPNPTFAKSKPKTTRSMPNMPILHRDTSASSDSVSNGSNGSNGSPTSRGSNVTMIRSQKRPGLKSPPNSPRTPKTQRSVPLSSRNNLKNSGMEPLPALPKGLEGRQRDGLRFGLWGSAGSC